MKIPGPWPLEGRVLWLTPEQGGRESGPPVPNDGWDYAQSAFVPPHDVSTGLASFALRGFHPGAWTSPAEGRWLIVDSDGDQHVEPGTVIVCTEGTRVVAYFHVDKIHPMPPDVRRDRRPGTAPSVS